MKQVIKYLSVLCLAGMFLTACEDLFDVKSNQYMSLDNTALTNPNDSIYSMLGILKQLRDLESKYVVLNELRGDLMDVGEYASVELQEISAFKATIANSWIWARDYYTVINSCNYLIHKMGDTLTNHYAALMLPEVVQAKTIRAWVYLQLLSNYGKAVYLDKPVITVEEAQKQYNFSSYDEILPKLINDLEPYSEIRQPEYGTIGRYNSSNLFLNTKCVLADLYLWNRNYLEAAQTCYSLIAEAGYTVSGARSYWDASGQYKNNGWPALFADTDAECISIIGFEASFSSSLLGLTLVSNAPLVPSANYLNFTQSQPYADFFTINNSRVDVIKEGDLRGEDGSYMYVSSSLWDEARPLIYKYGLSTRSMVYLYRVTKLYLRYAEAVNQLNKPTLALAILNEGLNARTTNPLTGSVEASEITPMETWMDFSAAVFDLNIGTRQRGLGMSTTNFVVIPPSTIDSIGLVEKAIRDELALETAFEGCRFPDLMRMARHRNNPALLAEAVAEKHPNKEAMRAFLMQEQNWYFPYPEK